MTLQELQSMIKEEFDSFIKEQAPMGVPAPPTPPAPGAPAVDVGPGDGDAMEPPMGGPQGAEAQLQKIFGMLKSYFEGGEEGMEPDMDDMDDAADDMGAPELDAGDDGPGDDVEVDAEEEDEPMEEAYGERNGGNATSTSGKYGGAYGATGTDTGNAQLHEGFKSRLQKLANIKK